jgi:hypothetical protein
MHLSDIILRAFGVRTWKPSPHYAECRRQAEVRLGDLSLPGEDAGAEMGNWPRLGAPSPTHADCILAGAALEIDYATATGMNRMRCVTRAVVAEIGRRLINDETARAVWVNQVYTQAIAAITAQ